MNNELIKEIFSKFSGKKLLQELEIFKTELNNRYPTISDLKISAYLYMHDLPQSAAYCDRSSKNKRLLSLSDGFLKFCGNQTACICNKENAEQKRLDKSDEQKQLTKEKRKNTTMAKYGVDNIAKSKHSIEKAANTCLERYGTPSPTQSPQILEKVRNSMLKNHGVEYGQQDLGIRQKAEKTWINKYGANRPAKNPVIKNKMSQTMLEKYGVEHNMQLAKFVELARINRRHRAFEAIISARPSATPLFNLEDFKVGNSDTEWQWKCNTCSTIFHQKIISGKDVRCTKCYDNQSYGEVEIRNWLESKQVKFIQKDRKLIAPFELDFFLPDHNIAIEFNGLWWHSDKIIQNKKYHYEKFEMTKKAGIKLIQIWEHDFKYKKEILWSRLSHALHQNSIKIGARKCIIKNVSYKDAKLFLETYHLQGFRPSKYTYGLFYNDDLIAVITMSKSRYNKKYDWEIIRYAIKSGVTVQGGLSKFLSHIKLQHGACTVISYADLCWGLGDGYKTAGFTLEKITAPNYYYFKNINDVRSRLEFQKHKIKHLAAGNTEKEIAENMGYNRFYDAGNAVWIKQL